MFPSNVANLTNAQNWNIGISLGKIGISLGNMEVDVGEANVNKIVYIAPQSVHRADETQ